MAKPYAVKTGSRIDDASAYKGGTKIFPVYRFPFTVLDPKYGRIEWCVEFLRGPRRRGQVYIGAIALWTRQTRDPQYQNVVFQIPCFTEAITGSRTARERDHFLHYVWRTGFCPEHNAQIFEAYPDNKHSVLVVEANSSMSAEVYFE